MWSHQRGLMMGRLSELAGALVNTYIMTRPFRNINKQKLLFATCQGNHTIIALLIFVFESVS
jgi:hypothetical protein